MSWIEDKLFEKENSGVPARPNKFLQWVKKGITRADFFVIALLSAIVAALTLYSVLSSDVYFWSKDDPYIQAADAVITAPVGIFMMAAYYVLGAGSPGSSEGPALGAAILAVYTSPLSAFVFWFLVFWFLARLSVMLLSHFKLNMFWKHALSIATFLLIVSPYVFYYLFVPQAGLI